MKTKLLLALYLMLCIDCFSQGNNIYTYYAGKRVNLFLSEDTILAYFKRANVSEDYVRSRYNTVEKIELDTQKSDSLFAYLIKLQEGTSRDNLITKEYVWDIEPVVNGVPVSNMFYVHLNQEGDSSLLVDFAEEMGTTVKGKVPYCNGWYELYVNKNSMSNALEMSNYMWETGAFREIDAGYVANVSMNSVSCPTDALTDSLWWVDAINACGAWQYTSGNTNVKVAVVDGGIEQSHQEFTGVNVSASYDAWTGTYPAAIWSPHGTHVGGIIFANHNQYRIPGVSPSASMVNISCNGTQAPSEYVFNILSQAIGYAVQQSVKVINNSWGAQLWSVPYALLESAIDNAISSGIVMTFASGNYSPQDFYTGVFYPAKSNKDFLVVGAVDSLMARASFSSYGDQLDVVAPGVNIYSSVNNNQYQYMSGTSMAAPFVSGTAALNASACSGLSAAQSRRIIKGTAQKVGGYNYVYSETHPNGSWNEEMGHGLVDAKAAVIAANSYVYNKDIYICDDNGDDGSEPNVAASTVQDSPDIWITNTNGNTVTELQYGSTYYVKVRLHNNSSTYALLSSNALSVRWTINSNPQWLDSWTNGGTLCGYPRSGVATIIPSSSPFSNIYIAGGGTTVVTRQFTLPAYDAAICPIIPQSSYTCSIVAFINDGTFTIDREASYCPVAVFARENNNVAIKSYVASAIPGGPILQLIPNPSCGRVTAIYSLPENVGSAYLLVINPVGNIVLNQSLPVGMEEKEIDLQDVPKGHYLVRLMVDGEMIESEKLIIQ